MIQILNDLKALNKRLKQFLNGKHNLMSKNDELSKEKLLLIEYIYQLKQLKKDLLNKETLFFNQESFNFIDIETNTKFRVTFDLKITAIKE
jgi:hypothetical protein